MCFTNSSKSFISKLNCLGKYNNIFIFKGIFESRCEAFRIKLKEKSSCTGKNIPEIKGIQCINYFYVLKCKVHKSLTRYFHIVHQKFII